MVVKVFINIPTSDLSAVWGHSFVNITNPLALLVLGRKNVCH